MTSTIKVNTIQDSCGSALVTKCGSNITIGASGKNILLASGANQTGFGRTGSVDWCTTAKTSPFSAVSGNGYFINTSGGVVTVTLPSSPSAGNIVALKDYAGTWNTNNLTIGRGGSKLNGTCSDAVRSTRNESLTLVYVDGTQGWVATEEGTGYVGEDFLCVAGGNVILTCGNYKSHVFTSDGTLTVNSLATVSANNTVDYFVVAGGGGSGTGSGGGGGGGAGGFRMSNDTCMSAPVTSPLANSTGITVTASAYPITVGGGGAGAPVGASPSNNGSNSVFSTITSAGGGGGGAYNPNTGKDGGSGGGGGDNDGSPSIAGGSGNTPPVSPAQGTNGGSGFNGPGPDSNQGGGGGGGAAVAGTTAPSAGNGGPGGTGSYVSNALFGPTAPSYGTAGPVSNTRYFAGGGGGAGHHSNATGGTGGGGAGGSPSANPTGNAGTVNTGGGAGGGRTESPVNDRLGGSGIVVIRYKYQ